MSPNDSANQYRYGPIILIGSLFFVFGFVTWINSVLIPYFKLICGLSVKEAMLVAFAFYISYFLMAFPSCFILKKTGCKNGMMLGLLVMAAGALLFVPAANTRTYSIFLIGLFVEAAGLTLLQTAANPYLTILGSIESAASRISVMGVCNKAAGAVAPLLLVGVMVKNPNEIDEVREQLTTVSLARQNIILDNLSERLVLPYICISIVLIGLSAVIRLSRLPDINGETANADETAQDGRLKLNLFSHAHLVLGSIAIFCGVGAEVLAIDTIINYAQYTGASFREAKYFASYTLLIMIISYCIGIFMIPKIISQRKALFASSLLGIACVILALLTKGLLSVWFIAMLGLGNALLWPAIWPLSLKGLGKLTGKGSALLIMGLVGGAAASLLYGALSDVSNPQFAYCILIPFYLFILYFSTFRNKAIKQVGSSMLTQ